MQLGEVGTKATHGQFDAQCCANACTLCCGFDHARHDQPAGASRQIVPGERLKVSELHREVVRVVRWGRPRLGEGVKVDHGMRNTRFGQDRSGGGGNRSLARSDRAGDQ